MIHLTLLNCDVIGPAGHGQRVRAEALLAAGLARQIPETKAVLAGVPRAALRGLGGVPGEGIPREEHGPRGCGPGDSP